MSWLNDFGHSLNDFAGNIGSFFGFDNTNSILGDWFEGFGNNDFSKNVDGFLNYDPSVIQTANISDAVTYGNIQGSNVEEQLQWLISHDPENASGWAEQLLGYRANKESLQDARAYEKWMEDTRIQRAAKDLEAAGINPILAYQYLSNGNGNVGVAGFPDSNVSTNATSKENNLRTVATSKQGNNVKLAGILGTIIGIIIKAIL